MDPTRCTDYVDLDPLGSESIPTRCHVPTRRARGEPGSTRWIRAAFPLTNSTGSLIGPVSQIPRTEASIPTSAHRQIQAFLRRDADAIHGASSSTSVTPAHMAVRWIHRFRSCEDRADSPLDRGMRRRPQHHTSTGRLGYGLPQPRGSGRASQEHREVPAERRLMAADAPFRPGQGPGPLLRRTMRGSRAEVQR